MSISASRPDVKKQLAHNFAESEYEYLYSIWIKKHLCLINESHIVKAGAELVGYVSLVRQVWLEDMVRMS